MKRLPQRIYIPVRKIIVILPDKLPSLFFITQLILSKKKALSGYKRGLKISRWARITPSGMVFFSTAR
jgi:hypothetical protein